MPGRDDDNAPRPPQPAQRPLRIAPHSGDVAPGRSRPRITREPDEGVSEEDLERFGGVTRTCTECGKEVFDDAAVCYHCGHAFERTTAGSTLTKRWVVVTVLVLVGAMVVGVLWAAL